LPSLEALSQDDVHVWVASTETAPAALDELLGLLSDVELARADRLKFETHRLRFLTGRAIRRRILSVYTGQPARELVFETGPRGKPELAGQGIDGIRINDSESDGLAVYAVARGRAIGVDVERLREVSDADRLIESFASPRERASFSRIPPPERQAAFLRWWTAKEAFVKALGEGLYRPLDSFSISFEDGATPQLDVVSEQMPTESRDWYIEGLQPKPGYVACVVVEGSRPRLTLRSWDQWTVPAE
jgi:4'-phosphopantetheinyl transferase